MSQYVYGQFGPEHLSKLEFGLRLYNQQKYWECHEYLEDHWMEDVGDQARLVYWSVIQVATALYHARDHNLAGAQGMLSKAQDKIKRIESSTVETKILKKIDWEEFKRRVKAISAKDAELEDFERLKHFNFPVEG